MLHMEHVTFNYYTLFCSKNKCMAFNYKNIYFILFLTKNKFKKVTKEFLMLMK